MASSPSGFDALAGYAVPMDKIIRRAIATLKEGKEVEYGLLGIRADREVHELRLRGSARLACRPRAASGQRSDRRRQRHPGHRLRVVDPGGQRLSRRAKQFVSRSFAATRSSSGRSCSPSWRWMARSSPPIGPRPGAVCGSSILPRSTGVSHPRFGEPRAAWALWSLKSRTDLRRRTAGIKRGQFIRKVGGKDVRSPQEFADAVASQEGPVTLDTDLGQVTVK